MTLKKFHELNEEEKYKYLKVNLASLYGRVFQNKLIRRIRDCYHVCLWCKYRKICELSWWKR